MRIAPIRNNIIFKFMDKVNKKGEFMETTSYGLSLPGHHDNSAKTHRWATIVALGPDCSDILREPGCEILIEALRWTHGFVFEGERMWKTDETQLLAYRYPEDKV